MLLGAALAAQFLDGIGSTNGKHGPGVRTSLPIAPLSDLHASARGGLRMRQGVFHSHLSSRFMPSIGATAWRVKTALTREQGARGVCRLLVQSGKIRHCDSMLPQLLRTLMGR
jgi:hypothetical protein